MRYQIIQLITKASKRTKQMSSIVETPIVEIPIVEVPVASDSESETKSKVTKPKFAGKYKKDDELIVGEMSQAGMTWETIFTLELQEKLVVTRPQEVGDSVSYYTEDVEIANGDIILGATVTMPTVFFIFSGKF